MVFSRWQDSILISNRFRSAITDIGSDHNLLKINFRVKLRVKTGNKYNEKRKMVNIFQNPKWKQEYAIEINNNLKYWKIWTMKIVLTMMLMKNGKTFKQDLRKPNSSL